MNVHVKEEPTYMVELTQDELMKLMELLNLPYWDQLPSPLGDFANDLWNLLSRYTTYELSYELTQEEKLRAVSG